MALQNLHQNTLLTINLDQGFACRNISVFLKITFKFPVFKSKKKVLFTFINYLKPQLHPVVQLLI